MEYVVTSFLLYKTRLIFFPRDPALRMRTMFQDVRLLEHL